jgi:hypothetical protein
MGNDDAVFEDMQQLAKDRSQQIKKSTLKDHEAHTAMNITITKKLEYPLVAVHLACKQCDKVTSRLLAIHYQRQDTIVTSHAMLSMDH